MECASVYQNGILAKTFADDILNALEELEPMM
mgnify:CR=1 FL=1